jgi:integrase
MRDKIIKTTVDALKKTAIAEAKTIYCYDSEMIGFGAYATKTGATSFFIEYRMGGRGAPNKRLTIGKFGILTPTEAREIAKSKLGAVHNGIDVAQAEKDQTQRLANGTFREIAEKYIDKESKPGRHWQETRRVLACDAYPAFGSRPISAITKQEIRTQLDLVGRRATSAERKLYAALSPLFKWAVERDTPAINPMTGISAPNPAEKRKHVLNSDELKALWLVTGDLGYPFGPLYRLLLLTGQRREEVAGMRWEEINLLDGTWRLPPKAEFQPQRTKNGLEHIVDLSPPALNIVNDLSSCSQQGLVFTTTGATPVSGFGKVKARIDALMTKRLDTKLRKWRNHDLRRTMATFMGELLDVDEGVIERILNHTTGGLKGIYQRQEYRDKRRQALNAWATYIENMAGEECPGHFQR